MFITGDIEVYNRKNYRKGIPKQIFQIWLGPFEPPHEWMNTWKDFCLKHGWNYKLWRDKDIELFGLQNKKAFDASVSYQQKSDIARYEIIHRYGGLYMDCDMVYLGNNLEDYIDFDNSSFISVNESPSPAEIGAPYCANGWFASVPGHPSLRKMIDLIPERVKMPTEHTFIKTGPILFNMCLEGPLVVLNHYWIFPLDFHKKHNIKDPKIFKKKALVFTYNGMEYPHIKKLKSIEQFGKCS
jgi:inositol phosphorylceramide mannosyltransferase catalytic subunit